MDVTNVKDVKVKETVEEVAEIATPSNEDFEKIEKLNNALKSEISGLNRKNGELINTNNDFMKRLDNLEAEKLTEGERRELELKNREATIKQNEAELLRKTNYLELVKIADSKKYSLKLLDFIDMTDREKAIAQLETLQTNIDEITNERMSNKMSSSTPPAGTETGASGAVNPFAKETYNLTEQIKIKKTNPELYAKLKAVS